MENNQQPFFGHHHHDNVVNGVVPSVSSQNSHGFTLGTQHDPDDILLPVDVDAEIPENSQSQYESNADGAGPNSPPTAAQNFHADSPADIVNIIDQIMSRAPPPPPPTFPLSDGHGFEGDSNYLSNGDTPSLYMPPEPNSTTFTNNMSLSSGNYQTQTAPLYIAASSSNGINSGAGQSASNYFFPENDMMQQSSPQRNWQGNGSAGINQFGQYSVSTAALFSPQAYNFFQTAGLSTALISRPQHESSLGNDFLMNVNFNSQNNSPRGMPESFLPPGCNNTMNTSPVIYESYSYSLPVSASNARPEASFGNPGRRATSGSTMSTRIELGYHNTFTSNAPQRSPSRSSSSTESTREITRQDSSGTHVSSATSHRRSSGSRRQENYYHQTLSLDEQISNRVYDPHYAELGLPVDPYLRMFNQHPEFWKKVHGNGDLSKK